MGAVKYHVSHCNFRYAIRVAVTQYPVRGMDIKVPHTCRSPEIRCTLYDLNIRRTWRSHTIPCTPQDLKIRHTCCITDIRCTPLDVTIRPTYRGRTVPCRSQEVIIRNSWCGHFGRQSNREWYGLEDVHVVKFKWHTYEYGPWLLLRVLVYNSSCYVYKQVDWHTDWCERS